MIEAPLESEAIAQVDGTPPDELTSDRDLDWVLPRDEALELPW